MSQSVDDEYALDRVAAACPACGHYVLLDEELGNALALPLETIGQTVETPDGVLFAIPFDEVVATILDWYGHVSDILATAKYLRESAAPVEARAEPAVSRDRSHVLVASERSKHFHNPDCEWAAYFLGSPFVVWFSSHEEAVASGRKPCKTCRA